MGKVNYKEVLPIMAEGGRKRAINRLQTMYPLRALVDEMYQESIEARKAGNPVAWCMADEGWCEPFFNALGIEAVYPENYGTVCAASGAAQAYLERSDSEGFPTHVCGYARNCLGYTARMVELGQIPPEAPMGGMPKPMLLLGQGRICDARFKWFQALGRYLDTPMWTIELPAPGVEERLMEGAYERDVKFMVEELREFVIFLERLLGKKMDWDKLEEMIRQGEELSRVWYEVNELRKARPCPMHSRDFWSSMSAAYYLPNPKVAIDLYHKMYDEVKERIDNHIGALPIKEKYRLIFVGLPPWHSLRFFDQLAERGWNFVIENAYHPPSPIDLSKVNDPLERQARLCYRKSRSTRRGEDAKAEEWAIHPTVQRNLEYVVDYQCDGAFLHPLISCRAFSADLMLTQDLLMKKLNVPSLVVEGDIVDLKLFDPVDTLRKAETFEETMDHYRKVRQEKGLNW